MIETYPVLQDTKNGVVQVFWEEWTWLGTTIPKGFPTDGTTFPFLLSWLIPIARLIVPRRGPYVFASYIHDYCLKISSRKEAALKFKEALEHLGASPFQCFIRYTGVRIYDQFKLAN